MSNVITFPTKIEEQVSNCSDCGSTIRDRQLRIFCDPCIEMNDGPAALEG